MSYIRPLKSTTPWPTCAYSTSSECVGLSRLRWRRLWLASHIASSKAPKSRSSLLYLKNVVLSMCFGESGVVRIALMFTSLCVVFNVLSNIRELLQYTSVICAKKENAYGKFTNVIHLRVGLQNQGRPRN